MWQQRCDALGVPLSLEAYVFSPAPDGADRYLPRAITQRYRRLALRLKLCSTRLHSLRHYSATELVAAGVDIRTVAGRLGHGSGGATTLRVYAAWVDEADRRAATTMATVLPRPVPKASVLVSPYEAIASSLRDQIASGELRPGDELPTVAQLAVANTVAVGTAHRAIAALKAEGLIEVARGRRAVVSGGEATTLARQHS
jgi:integrase